MKELPAAEAAFELDVLLAVLWALKQTHSDTHTHTHTHSRARVQARAHTRTHTPISFSFLLLLSPFSSRPPHLFSPALQTAEETPTTGLPPLATPNTSLLLPRSPGSLPPRPLPPLHPTVAADMPLALALQAPHMRSSLPSRTAPPAPAPAPPAAPSIPVRGGKWARKGAIERSEGGREGMSLYPLNRIIKKQSAIASLSLYCIHHP